MSEPTFTIVKNCNDQIRIRIHHTTIIGVSHRISFLTPGTYTGDQLVAEYNRVVSQSRWFNSGDSNDNITDITGLLKTKVYPDEYVTWNSPALGFNVLTWDKENRLLKFHSSTTNTGAPNQHDFYFEYCPTSFTHCQFFNNVIPIRSSPTAVNTALCKTDRVYYDYTHTELLFVNIGTSTLNYYINDTILCTLGPGEYSEQTVEDLLLNYNGVEPGKTITCETVREGPYLVNYFTFTGFDTRYTVSNKDNIRLSAFYETPDTENGWDQVSDGFLIKSGSIIKHVRKIAPELTNDYAIETFDGTKYISEHYFFRSPVVRNCFKPFYQDICPVLSSSNNTTDYIVNLPDDQNNITMNFNTRNNTSTDNNRGYILSTIYITNNNEAVLYWVPFKTSFYIGFGPTTRLRKTYFPLENILIPDSYLCAEYSSLGKIYFKIDKKYTNLPYEYVLEQTQKENAIYTKVNDTLQVHTEYSTQNYDSPYLSLTDNNDILGDYSWTYKIDNPKHLMFVDTPPPERDTTVYLRNFPKYISNSLLLLDYLRPTIDYPDTKPTIRYTCKDTNEDVSITLYTELPNSIFRVRNNHINSIYFTLVVDPESATETSSCYSISISNVNNLYIPIEMIESLGIFEYTASSHALGKLMYVCYYYANNYIVVENDTIIHLQEKLYNCNQLIDHIVTRICNYYNCDCTKDIFNNKTIVRFYISNEIVYIPIDYYPRGLFTITNDSLSKQVVFTYFTNAESNIFTDKLLTFNTNGLVHYDKMHYRAKNLYDTSGIDIPFGGECTINDRYYSSFDQCADSYKLTQTTMGENEQTQTVGEYLYFRIGSSTGTSSRITVDTPFIQNNSILWNTNVSNNVCNNSVTFDTNSDDNDLLLVTMGVNIDFDFVTYVADHSGGGG